MQYEGQMADQQRRGGVFGGLDPHAAQIIAQAAKPARDIPTTEKIESMLSSAVCRGQDLIAEVTNFNDRMAGAEPPVEHAGKATPEASCWQERMVLILEHFGRDLDELERQVTRLRRLG